MTLSEAVKTRFWDKVAITNNQEECWLWQATKTGNGYGNFKASIWGHMPAHRVSYWLSTGNYPEHKQIVRHRCDTPLCVNPNHLEIGTQADNMRDAWARGRRRR
jgi:hypothetical protein